MRHLRLAVLAVLCIVTLASTSRPIASAQTTAAVRTFEFTYQVQVPADPEAAGTANVWIPIPPSDDYQDISNLHIESPVRFTQGRDLEYGNAFALFSPSAEQSASGFTISLRFRVTRREHLVRLTPVARNTSSKPVSPDPLLARYLQPDKLVPLNETIMQLATENTVGDTTPLQKARHIYEYVVATMSYDKSGEGWGRGDAVWACTSQRGNCTDFHSLLIGMMRASGIPARFEIGFPLPDDKSQTDIPGYHCWAEFYLDDLGWVPVDASAAWETPDKKDYFFGAHDANRVLFTTGRDIHLSAEQKGGPLNYFVYPYEEVKGQPTKNLQTRFAFRDVGAARNKLIATNVE